MSDPTGDELVISPESFSSLEELEARDPEKAAILIDLALKRRTTNERENWVMRAQMIAHLKKTELWRYHPENFSSFFEYCLQPEIDIAPSIVSDMVAVVTYAPHLMAVGINIFDVILRAGHSKVRQLIPQIREAHRTNTLEEEIAPKVAAIEGMSFRDLLALNQTSNVRSSFDLEATYEELPSGQVNIVFKDLDVDDLEYLTRKVGIKRWFDQRGNRIDPPLNDPKMLAD